MSRVACAILVIVLFSTGILAVPESVVWSRPTTDVSSELGFGPNRNPQVLEKNPTDESVAPKDPSTGNTPFATADEQLTGVLEPVPIEQRGYVSSGNLSARTDTHEATSTNLSIDASHGWKADLALVNVSSLQRLYVTNGSFNTGTAGWNTTSYSADSSGWENEVATYDPSGTRFVSVQNQGKLQGTTNYKHFATTYVLWTQRVTNIPRTTQFTLRFSYLYLTGPIGSNTPGKCCLTVYFNQTRIWNQSLAALSQRGVWYNNGSMAVNMPTVGSVFDFKIGIFIDNEMLLSTNANYSSGNSVNAAHITVGIDDVLLTGAAPPSFGAVELRFKVGSTAVAVAGSSGRGSASIMNSSYWTSSSLTIRVQSNTSVSFYYVASLLSHHFGNSSWTTETAKKGVSYNARLNSSSNLRIFTYLGSFGSYDQLSLRITIPKDWGNVTVYDPFVADVTAQCSVGAGLVTVPHSILDRLGWWQLALQAPNYARSITIQKYNPGTSSWANSSSFRTGNTTRGLVTIGRGSSHPAILTDLNATWGLPNGTSWSSEKLGPSTNGTIKTVSHMIDASAAGRWRLTVFWSNGSELAYADSYFAVYHRTNLVPVYSLIDTDDGQIVANVLRYTDTETGKYLTDDSATVKAKWSASIVNFLPNQAKKWWEADFDTSLVTPGTHTVRANASFAYFDDSYCTFVIRSYVRTRLGSPNTPWTTCGWNQTCHLTFLFEAYNHTTALWIPVTNSSGDVRVHANWTLGQWTVEQSAIPGVYNALLDTGARPAGNWLLNATMTRSNYETGQVLLTLIVSRAESSLVVLGDELSQANVSETLPLKLKYSDEGGFPVGSADVTVQNVAPSQGLLLSQVVEVPGQTGNYSMTITAKSPGVFTIRIVASAANLEPAAATFVVAVRDIATDVNVLSGDSASIGLTDTFTAVFRYEMWNGSGIGSAGISVVYSGPSLGLSWSVPQPLGGGNYSIDFDPSSSGTYLVTIAASKEFYQTSSDSFFLIVGDISSQLVLVNGTSGVIEIGESYRLVVRYANTTGYGLDGADVHIDSFIPESGLDVMSTVPLGSGFYSIVLHPTLTVAFVILVRVSTSNHQVKFATFTLNCMKIASVLLFDNATTTIPIHRNFALFMRFQTESLQNLPDATIVVANTPVGLEFGLVRDLGNGHYSLNITPLAMGTYDIVLRASLQNYLNASAAFTLGVTAIPMSVQLLSESYATEGITFEVSVRIYETESGIPISGAEVTFRISAIHAGEFYPMTETSTAGTYSSTYSMPTWQDYTNYTLEIKANKDNYTLSSTFSVPFHKTTDLMIRMGPLIVGSGSGVLLLMLGLIGLRVSRRRKREQNLEALSVKRRFDDVSNILGLIVLHKKSGIPLYSRVLKGGFEESMVSAFISAITNFRSEFRMDEKQWDFEVVPISDIISAVPTRNLICAFITVSSPSPAQQVKMEAYGRAAGAMFDELLAVPQSDVLGAETVRMFDSLFYDLMDGILLLSYRKSAEVSLPRDMKCLEAAAVHIQNGEGFKLEELARGMAACGVEESRAYKMILDAIEKDLLVKAEQGKGDASETVVESSSS